jgi:5-methylcytosine-specific restriction protein B
MRNVWKIGVTNSHQDIMFNNNLSYVYGNSIPAYLKNRIGDVEVGDIILLAKSVKQGVIKVGVVEKKPLFCLEERLEPEIFENNNIHKSDNQKLIQIFEEHEHYDVIYIIVKWLEIETSNININFNNVLGFIAVKDSKLINKIIKEYFYMEKYLKILNSKKQIILQGPPGTGKTYLAKKIANHLTKSEQKLSPIQHIERYVESFKSNREIKELNLKRKNLIEDFHAEFPIKNINNLTLEDYCRGTGSVKCFCYWIEIKLLELGRFSPGQGGNYVYGVYFSPTDNAYKYKDPNDTEYFSKIKSALHKLLNDNDDKDAKSILRQSYILKILNSYFPDEYFPVYSHKHLNLIASIFSIDIDKKDDIQLNKEINKKFIDLKNKYKSDISSYDLMKHIYDKFDIKSDNIDINDIAISVFDTLGETKTIQFHPAYTYEDFVRGITAKTNEKGQVIYEVENKTLVKFAQKAIENESFNYVLIIDEINRANLPAVLGELIYALEYRYDEKNEAETTVESIYGVKKFSDEKNDNKTLKLPKNLLIIGTMNTADRSVGHLDYAIRRRFAFVDLLPNRDVIKTVNKSPEAIKLAEDLFDEVEKLFIGEQDETGRKIEYLASDFNANDVQIGHSYFLTNIQDNDDGKPYLTEIEQLKLKLEYEILPILNEYLKDGILLENARIKIETLKEKYLL